MNYLIIFIILIVLVLLNYSNIESFQNTKSDFIQDSRIEMIREYFKTITPKKKYFLSKQCNVKEYNRFDIEPSMEDYIKNIIYPYINDINQKFSYDFVINKISNISEEIDDNKNRRYIIDFFIYENKNFFVTRVIIDIVLFFNNIKYLNNIVIANANINYNKINTKGIYGIDSNIVIKKQNVEKNNNKLDGIDSSTLEHSNIDSNPYTSRDCMRSEVRNKWILPKGTPEDCSFPCKKESNCWDKYGVLYSCDNNPKCIGINTSATPKPFYPYYNPTITGTPANNNNYLDLMKLTRGWIKPLWQ
jgi:hypothetical protein